MLYDIGLTIAYDYDRPAVAGRHILRLMPADLPGEQRRITGLLGISPEPAERRPFVDFFGNSAVEVAFRAEHDEILLRVTSRVERIPQAPVLDISPGLAGLAAEIADWRSLDADAPHHFLGPSPRVAPGPETTAYAEAGGDELPPDWRSAIEAATRSAFLREALGERLHHVFLALKRAEYRRFAAEITALERTLYGEVV